MDFDLQQLWADNQSEIISTGLNVIYALVVLIVGMSVIGRLVRSFKKVLRKRGVDETLLPTMGGVVKGLLVVVLLIAVTKMVGIDTTGLVAVLGAAGLAVGLALQGSLANFAGGILILVLKPFKNGDFIEVNGESGTVEAISIVNTKLKTPDNKVIFMPNGSVAGATIVNFSMEDKRRLDIVFGIGYDDDFDKAKEIILKLAGEDERIDQEPAPFARVGNLGDSSVDITTRFWLDRANYWPTKFDLIEKVKKAFDEEGITIPYPQRDIHVFNEK